MRSHGFIAQVSLDLHSSPVLSPRIHCRSGSRVVLLLVVDECDRLDFSPTACVLSQDGNDGNGGASNEWESSPSAAPASLHTQR